MHGERQVAKTPRGENASPRAPADQPSGFGKVNVQTFEGRRRWSAHPVRHVVRARGDARGNRGTRLPQKACTSQPRGSSAYCALMVATRRRLAGSARILAMDLLDAVRAFFKFDCRICVASRRQRDRRRRARAIGRARRALCGATEGDHHSAPAACYCSTK